MFVLYRFELLSHSRRFMFLIYRFYWPWVVSLGLQKSREWGAKMSRLNHGDFIAQPNKKRPARGTNVTLWSSSAWRFFLKKNEKKLIFPNQPASTLANEIPEESGQFRFLRSGCYANIKGSVGLILEKASVMRISIPLDLSSRPFIPLPRFICRRRPLPLLASSLVFTPRRSA